MGRGGCGMGGGTRRVFWGGYGGEGGWEDVGVVYIGGRD